MSLFWLVHSPGDSEGLGTLRCGLSCQNLRTCGEPGPDSALTVPGLLGCPKASVSKAWGSRPQSGGQLSPPVPTSAPGERTGLRAWGSPPPLSSKVSAGVPLPHLKLGGPRLLPAVTLGEPGRQSQQAWGGGGVPKDGALIPIPLTEEGDPRGPPGSDFGGWVARDPNGMCPLSVP